MKLLQILSDFLFMAARLRVCRQTVWHGLWELHYAYFKKSSTNPYIRAPFGMFVDWRQCAAVMQKKAATVIPSRSGWDNVTVA